MLAHPDGKRIYREFHNLRRDNLDQDALKVVNRLNRHGHRSYLVGGCVRDMILGRRPKDFDVVTTATPAQIRKIFSNSRSIGRRFKIVHVIFRGGKIIEVSTFRSLPEHRLGKSANSKETDADFLMTRDNDYGNPREDAARRDFSINALYFDPRNESIIDYVNGFQDIENRKILVIGDPDMSFREDPVRMLRAAKFAALLDFQLDSACVKAIRRNRDEITKASPHRMLEEYGKIFRTGKTAEIFGSFMATGLLKSMLPEVYDFNEKMFLKDHDFASTAVGDRLFVADKKLADREDLTGNIYFALLLADLVSEVFESRRKNIAEYVRERILPVCHNLSIPGKDRDRLLHMFICQPRFLETKGRRKEKPEFFRKKPFFYEAFMVFKIYSISTGNEEAIQKAMFWEIGPRSRPPENGKVISMFSHRKRMAASGRRRAEKNTGTGEESSR